MNLPRITVAFALVAGLALSGCSGGGGGGGVASIPSGGGIGGTGITSNGTIDGFGSIFVNGVEFETDESEVLLDGVISTQSALRLGMVVTVTGTINEDGKTGTADQVTFDDEVQGPVTTIEMGQDGDSMLLVVLGVEVIAERTGTVFDEVTFDTLLVGDLVEVSGFVENGSQLRATRIEKKSTFVPGTSEVELKGTVSALTSTQFNLGEFVVDYSNADLSDIPGGSIANGQLVEAHGTLTDNIIVAERVEAQDSISDDFDDNAEVSVQGAISQFVDKGQFEVNGVAVDATNASLEPSGLVLADGMIVEAEGTWSGAILVAKEVKSRRGRIELEAMVASVDTAMGTVTLQFFAGTVTVQVDSTTLLTDDTGQVDSLTLGNINTGDFLEVEAIEVGDSLVATRIKRDEPDDNVLQAQVESFNAGSNITLLGITFGTTGATFENQDDNEIGADLFFGQLQVGDLVKVKDEALADGMADEVEFEQEGALDGEEFEDDDSNDDCGDEGERSDDDCESDDEEDSEDECDSSGSGSDDCASEDDEEDEEGPEDEEDSEDDENPEDEEDPEDGESEDDQDSGI